MSVPGNVYLKAELAFRDERINSDKVYKLEIAAAGGQSAASDGRWNIHFLHGRRGASLQGGMKNSAPIPKAAARILFFALLREKLNRGYRLTAIGGDSDQELSLMFAQFGAPVALRQPPPKSAADTARNLRLSRFSPEPKPEPPPPKPLRVKFTPPPKPDAPAAPGFGSGVRKIRLEEDDD
jgi:predicted DNA-binding WGR domain protein